MNKGDDKIIVKGSCGRVEYAVKTDGSMPAKKDLESIKEKDKKSYRRITTLFLRFVQTWKLSESQFRRLKGSSIYEFKRHPFRIACFLLGRRCLLTHVFGKKDGSAFVQKEIEKATEIMREHLEYEKGVGS